MGCIGRPHDWLAQWLLLRDRLQSCPAHAERSSHGLAPLFIDVDRFKAVNDAVGHIEGDRLLGDLAGACRCALRNRDAGSPGGDEFVMTAPPKRRSSSPNACKSARASIRRGKRPTAADRFHRHRALSLRCRGRRRPDQRSPGCHAHGPPERPRTPGLRGSSPDCPAQGKLRLEVSSARRRTLQNVISPCTIT
ncbi:diguanylate cyclase [Billgrantia gudaonensis]|uniref:Diguanylate cyclase n=1 Tax=Billgrantia gudaonensis TaxID=376427 RepID=A0A3S0VSD8_9GAMM|nr:diguanylate cyclase [Halomonas gudaonensis]